MSLVNHVHVIFITPSTTFS